MKLNFRAIVFSFLLIAFSSSLHGQSGPQVVMLKNGAEYFGEVATIGDFSNKILNPWDNAHQIVLVDDGLRRLFFNINSVRNRSPLDANHPLVNPTIIEISQRVHHGNSRGYGNLAFGSFDVNGHRLVTSSSNEGATGFVQGITTITPHWCEVQTLADSDGAKLRNWTMRIPTSRVPRDVIRTLLDRQISDRKNPSDYYQIVDFYRERGEYNSALDELARIATVFPDLDERTKEQQVVIRQARARQWKRQVQNRIDVGQPGLADSMLRAFDRGGIASEILVEMADIQRELKDREVKVEQSKKPVLELIDRLFADADTANLEPAQIPMVESFRAELDADLSPENINRLDAFKNFANDDQISEIQKLSRALSGWFLGNNNATENFAVSQSFFLVRELVTEYLATADSTRRRNIMEELKKFEGGEPKYLAAMIANMVPPLAPDLSQHDASQPLRFDYQIEGSKANKEPLQFSYHVILPPEYDPYRRYPCIFTLPGDKDIERQLFRWCGPFDENLGIRLGQAMTNGYIVVCVDWKLPGQFEYGYSAREHSTIMSAYQKALRQFSIDTDRVFITGHGFGADAAYDIGISHPDHWAGVVGISGKIDRYPVLYKKHTHVRLPVYCVVGEKDLQSKDASSEAWNQWLPSKTFFDCTVVEYIGRSNEPFVEEIVEVFKWAKPHRRRLPDATGFKFSQCKVLRPWDSYFWFFELHYIPENKVEWPVFYGPPFPKTAIEMEARLSNNNFMLKPRNLNGGATVWLSPEFIDFQKKINIDNDDFKDFVSPSRQVLLEDVRRRSDRQHPFWANVRFKGKNWQPNLVE